MAPEPNFDFKQVEEFGMLSAALSSRSCSPRTEADETATAESNAAAREVTGSELGPESESESPYFVHSEPLRFL